jgi:dihydroorotate dehydrogenase electron transfer subunit
MTSVVSKALFETRVVANHALSGGYFELELESTSSNPVAHASPGQFVMLRGEWGRDLINGRAFSVLQVQSDRRFSILAKPFGRGTRLLQESAVGDRITCNGPLGRGFSLPKSGQKSLLVAGGVGLPPLHFYARRLAAMGLQRDVVVFYGGRSAADLVLVDDLNKWNVEVVLATEDGSRGHHGRVTQPLQARIADLSGKSVQILSCGPTPMLKAVRELALSSGIETYLCLEEQMACGFGVCLGCAVPVYGEKPYQYCCTDGPVFAAKEVRWS